MKSYVQGPRSVSLHRMPTHLTVVLDILFEQLQLLLLLGQGLLLFLQLRTGITEDVNFLLSYFFSLERNE